MAPTVNASSSPPASAGPTGSPQHQTHPGQTADGKKLRFPRFLRRTHSASAAPEAPPYALFLRNKRVSPTLVQLLLDRWRRRSCKGVFGSSCFQSIEH